MRILFFTIGAGIGAPLRYLIDKYFRTRATFPWGILFINVLGSFIAGAIATLETKDILFLGFGFCGAFTTWSAFMLDLDRDRKDLTKFALNIFLSIILGVIAAWAGLQIAS